MCAITGWLYVPGAAPEADSLKRMADRMRHRGPDDEGLFVDAAQGIALGHRRLAIIDLSAASHEPMIDPATGVTMVYNGELYNFHELRKELTARGHAFASSGDAEVVLRAWIEWGADCLQRFNGMFAVAMWDPRSRTLHLARDAMGMKPVYYLPQAEGVAFASEIKAFAALPGFRSQLDDIALQQYLEFGYVFDEERTMLAGLRKLPPGHRLEIRGGAVAAQHAWFVPPASESADARSEETRVDELLQTLRDVVRGHLIADVPLGLLLSGGLDSSLVAALAAREGPLQTITMGFAGSTVDERPQARLVADYIGSRHTEVLIHPGEVKAEALAGAWVFDDLFADWGTVTTRLLYRRCREIGLKCVLVGEGADELFGGYDVFRTPPRLGLWRMFRLYQRYAGRRHGRLFGRFRRAMQDYLDACGGDTFDAVRLFESRRQLPNQFVMKVDKASMAESVEARAPYLDVRIARLAYRTPRDWLLRGGDNKYLLRRAAARENLLPPEIAARAKFGAPLAASWMDDDAGFRGFARERLLDPRSATTKLGLAGAMHQYFDLGRRGRPFPASLSIFSNLAWRLLLLELWSDHYLGSSR